MHRRDFLAALAVGTAAGTLPRLLGAQQGTRQPALPTMTVYKSAYCGCCKNWVDHVKQAGFTVRTIDTEELGGVKAQMGVPATLQSCHTVMVGNYVVEGHVPAADVKRLLAEKPAVRGIAVPGMPVGSPGMEQGNQVEKYDVIAWTAQGRTSVFARH